MSHHGNIQSLPPRRYPALVLVPTGETFVDHGITYRCLRIERESEYDDHKRHPEKYGMAERPKPLPGKPGRPRKTQ